MVRRWKSLAAFVGLWVIACPWCFATEPLLQSLPAGVYLRSSTVVPAAQARAIGQRLGGNVQRLSNSVIQVHGRPIQVNVIAAADDASADKIFQSLSRTKPAPYCVRKDRVVVEYVGRDVDVELATKTSYELGFLPKPDNVRYRVRAELATVDQADYMACNPLFNQFLALKPEADSATIAKIDELKRGFRFGSTLRLRGIAGNGESITHEFEPAAVEKRQQDDVVVFSFAKLPARQGVPFVTISLDVLVSGRGMTRSQMPPSESCTAGTPFWPADDPEIRALAGRITAGKEDRDAKVQAILRWLAPGTNLRYEGQTGSRWGTRKALQQEFGHCWDFADCFVTLARAAGVPCRQVAGWLYGSSGHVWAEYFREGEGWQQVDPTGAGELPCGIYHVAYFTSEDGAMPILYLSMPKIEPLPNP